MSDSLPVVIIGGGPVGLAAAVHLLSRGLTPLVCEAGHAVGAGVRRWGHVRMFSPWQHLVDRQAAALLALRGWERPADGEYPTGDDLAGRYLEPLAATPELALHVHLRTRVTGVARHGRDVMKQSGRDEAPYLVRIQTPHGEADVLARAVIDASGTIESPAPLGAAGLPAIGEREAAAHIFYGIPDVTGRLRGRYAGRRVSVVGSGHSAMNALLDLARLGEEAPGTAITWVLRRRDLGQALGGAREDQLAERGRLGARVRALLDEGRLTLVTGFAIDAIELRADGVVLRSGDREAGPAHEVIAATGFRPDWSLLSEVRLDLDPAVQCPRALAPLIDPNVHSCGTVPPHGAVELRHPDADLYAIGMKSYGRAPTFLLLTGYEQARSVAAAIAGDWTAARRVELVLPATGACATDIPDGPAGACCGNGERAAGPAFAGRPARTLPLVRSAPAARGELLSSAEGSVPAPRR